MGQSSSCPPPSFLNRPPARPLLPSMLALKVGRNGRMSIQSFLVNLLAFVLLIILLGFSFLMVDRLVLNGRYTNPYNKDDVIKSLGERLNLQVQENNQLKEKINDIESYSENIKNKLEAVPSYQLTKVLTPSLRSNCGITLERGRLTFRDQISFKTGAESLTPAAKKSLDKMAAELLRLSKQAKFPWVLKVEGHTDAETTPSEDGYHSNWLIPYKRAYAVVQYFISKGVDAKRFYIASFSSYNKGSHPINRRVSLSFDYV
jgi:flagellar motor protein MotB